MAKLNYTLIAKDVLSIESKSLLDAAKRLDEEELSAIIERIESIGYSAYVYYPL